MMCPVIWQIDTVARCWHFVEILQCLFCNHLRNFDLGALAYLHKRRVLHRDVKPSHIFIGETGQADQLKITCLQLQLAVTNGHRNFQYCNI